MQKTYSTNHKGDIIDTTVYEGPRGDAFREFVKSILKRGNVKEKFMEPLLTDEAFEKYSIALTSASADPVNNYEFFEIFGDVLANKIIVCYMCKRFPQLKCSECVKVIARLKINYGSCQTFQRFAENLGFWPFISATEDVRSRMKKKLLEDSFEAFLGVTEIILDETFGMVGVGYNVVYDILASVFDEEEISLRYDTLYDPKTRLKQIFDMKEYRDKLGKEPKYDDKFVGPDGVRYVRIFGFITPVYAQYYQPGQPIEARFGGNKKWFKGKIMSVNQNRTYNIVYEDGEREKFVPAEMIRIGESAGYEIARVPIMTGIKDTEQRSALSAINYLNGLNYKEIIPEIYSRL